MPPAACPRPAQRHRLEAAKPCRSSSPSPAQRAPLCRQYPVLMCFQGPVTAPGLGTPRAPAVCWTAPAQMRQTEAQVHVLILYGRSWQPRRLRLSWPVLSPGSLGFPPLLPDPTVGQSQRTGRQRSAACTRQRQQCRRAQTSWSPTCWTTGAARLFCFQSLRGLYAQHSQFCMHLCLGTPS